MPAFRQLITMFYKLSTWCLLFFPIIVFAQTVNDSAVTVDGKLITLSEVVISNRLNVAAFIERVKSDTTFYKAFKTLRIIGYTSQNDIRMLDKKGNIKAGVNSTTQQEIKNHCRFMKVLRETITGDIYDAVRNFNYYTGELYAGLFFTKDSVCGETNIVKGRAFSTDGLSGMAKRKEQLKTLLFNPGKKIEDLPLISGKTAIFDKDMTDKYDMRIDIEDHHNQSCYVFKMTAVKSGVVVDEMITWFNEKTFEIVARNYSLSYRAGIYDFDVQMQVDMTKAGDYLVPAVIRYIGNWKAVTKKRERGIFTATLYDFKP